MNGKKKIKRDKIGYFILNILIKKKFNFFISLFAVLTVFAQTEIRGKIINPKKEIIPFVNIILQTSDSNSTILSYSYSNADGYYKIVIEDIGSFNVKISSLGYQQKIIPITIHDSTNFIELNVILEEKALELDEVILQTALPISIRKDTIVFQAKNFTKGNEEVVEDILRNLPGIRVDKEGRVFVGNQEIEKLTIDGDDFFERGYRLLSKNLPSYPVKSIELYKNYSNHKLLKGIEESKKVAMNITLKEESKNIWFGNLAFGYDVQLKHNYSTNGNLANFESKKKYFLISNLNNIGDDATGDIRQLIQPYRFNEPGSMGDNQSIERLVELTTSVPNFKSSRTNFNNQEVFSLNTIFKLTNRLKLKAIGFYNGDENDFFKSAINTFIGNGTKFTNIENHAIEKHSITGFGKLDIAYDISKTKTFSSTSKISTTDNNDISDLTFNTIATKQRLNGRHRLFDQKINYINKFTNNKVLFLTGRYINERISQQYLVNQYLFQDLFSGNATADNTSQLSTTKYSFTGFEAHLLERKKGGALLELKFGNELRIDKIQSIFEINEGDLILENPDNYQNNLIYISNELFLKSKYLFQINAMKFTANIDFHQLLNKIVLQDSNANQSPFFINPSLGINWNINSFQRIDLRTSFNTTKATLLDVSNNFFLSGFRSFSRGTGAFNQLNSLYHNLNYELSKWDNRFFANLLITYGRDYDYFSHQSVINLNFSKSELIKIKGRENFNLSTKLNYFLKSIKTNLKLNIGYLSSNFENIINNSTPRNVMSQNHMYGLKIRSGFSGLFNYHIGTEWQNNILNVGSQKNVFTSNLSYGDLSFIFSEKFNLDIQNEWYFFGDSKTNNSFYFLDVNTKYVIKKNKLSLFLDGRNLLDIKKFRKISISDISTSLIEYRLLPRFVLLKLKYRF